MFIVFERSLSAFLSLGLSRAARAVGVMGKVLATQHPPVAVVLDGHHLNRCRRLRGCFLSRGPGGHEGGGEEAAERGEDCNADEHLDQRDAEPPLHVPSSQCIAH